MFTWLRTDTVFWTLFAGSTISIHQNSGLFVVFINERAVSTPFNDASEAMLWIENIVPSIGQLMLDSLCP